MRYPQNLKEVQLAHLESANYFQINQYDVWALRMLDGGNRIEGWVKGGLSNVQINTVLLQFYKIRIHLY